MKLRLKKDIQAAAAPVTPPPVGAPRRTRGSCKEPLLAFLFGALVMTVIQSSSYEPAGRDSFYHIKMAVLLPEIGFPEHFHWLRHTILNQRNVSHHHGFHIMMIPFVYGSQWVADAAPQSIRDWAARTSSIKRLEYFKVGFRSWLASPAILGGKVLDVLLFGLVVLAVDLILRELQVGWRAFWVLAVAALPTDFLLRMAYIRAPVASLAILLLVLYCMLRRRVLWVAVLGAVYCHVYGGFVFFPVVVGCHVLSLVLTRRAWKEAGLLLLSAGLGLVVGLISHPFFPQNIDFLRIQLFETGLQTSGFQVRVGSEWRPINWDYGLQISAVILVIVVVTWVLRFRVRRVWLPAPLALLLLSVIFLGLTLSARRFIEYWPVFALLSSAALWRGSGESWSRFVDGLTVETQKIVTNYKQRSYVIILLAVMVAAAVTTDQARRSARCGFDLPPIQRAMEFLATESPAGSLVFADDWDEFPVYFYYNSHNDYVCGLDPQFTNSMDPQLWERFCVITQGRSPQQSRVTVLEKQADGTARPVERTLDVRLQDIAAHFGADYVVVDTQHQTLYRQLCSASADFKYLFPMTPSGTPPDKVPGLAVFRVLPPVPPETIEQSHPAGAQAPNTRR